MSNVNKKSAAQYLHNLIESVFQSIEHDQESMNELYEESGISREDLVSNIFERIKNEKREVRTAAAKARREEFLVILSKLKERGKSFTKEDIIARLKEFLKPETGSSSFAFFHKLEAMSDQDIRAMLEEIDLISLLEKSKEGDQE